MYKILCEDKVMVDKLAPERLEQEYSLVSDSAVLTVTCCGLHSGNNNAMHRLHAAAVLSCGAVYS
jgi:hypothetical protein